MSLKSHFHHSSRRGDICVSSLPKMFRVLCLVILSSVFIIPAAGQFGNIFSSLPSFSSVTNFTSNLIPSFPSLPCVGRKTLQGGRCVSREDCASSGGRVDNGCLSSSQICCIPTIKCGGVGITKDFQVSNQGYPFPDNSSHTCQYIIRRADILVGQLRIDFEILELGNPLTPDACDGDMVVVESGLTTQGFPLCGNNSGSHIVYPFTSDSVTLKVILGQASIDRQWLLRVRQLDSFSSLLSPHGCRQFYFERTGHIRSLVSGRHIRYSACFKEITPECDIKFERSFQESFSNDEAGNETTPPRTLQDSPSVSSNGTSRSCSSIAFFPPTASSHGGFLWCMDDRSTDTITVVGHPKIVYLEQQPSAPSFSIRYTYINC